jgi:hypothetical protein
MLNCHTWHQHRLWYLWPLGWKIDPICCHIDQGAKLSTGDRLLRLESLVFLSTVMLHEYFMQMKTEALCLVRCQGCSQLISSLSPLVNELFGGILRWAQTYRKTVVPQSSCLSHSQLVPYSFTGD